VGYDHLPTMRNRSVDRHADEDSGRQYVGSLRLVRWASRCEPRTYPAAGPSVLLAQVAGNTAIALVTRSGQEEDAAAINEGATQNGCAAKLPSLGFALLHEVSRVQRPLYHQNSRRHRTRHRLDNVTPIGDRGAVR